MSGFLAAMLRLSLADDMAGRVRAHAPKPQMASAPAARQQP
jgi:hypothetical protein